MRIPCMILAAAAFLLMSSAPYRASLAAGYHLHTRFAMRHCQEYGGTILSSGCYIRGDQQRRKLLDDEKAWKASHRQNW